jgi:hypothetical protein
MSACMAGGKVIAEIAVRNFSVSVTLCAVHALTAALVAVLQSLLYAGVLVALRVVAAAKYAAAAVVAALPREVDELATHP